MAALAAVTLVWMQYRSTQAERKKAAETANLVPAPQLNCASSAAMAGYGKKMPPEKASAQPEHSKRKEKKAGISTAPAAKTKTPLKENTAVFTKTTTQKTVVPNPDRAVANSPVTKTAISECSLPGILPVSGIAGKNFSPKTFKALGKSKKVVPRLCYDFDRHPSAWLIDAYAGPSLAQRSLTSRLEDRPYLNQRLSTESQRLAMNGGIRASLMFNRNLLVRTGLHYNQITEVFEYIDPAYVKYHIVATVVNGMTKIDTVGVEYGEHYQKVYNRYTTLDIPLMVGVEMRRGRSGVSINAGASFNIWFRKSGAIIDPLSSKPARFDAEGALEDKVFRQGTGVSACASIQWYYHLGPHFRVFAEPSFRQILRPVSLKTHPVEHRYSIIGLKLGATRIF
jgi:hypothetical protein